MLKLTLEEKEALADMLEHPGMPVLLRELEALAQDQATDVLKFDLSTGSDSELIRRKCRHEGACKLLASVQRRLDNLKAKQKV